MEKRTPRNEAAGSELRAMLRWLSDDGSPEAKRYRRRMVNDFMDTILQENREPSDSEFNTSLSSAGEHSDKVHALLNAHVAAWMKWKQNARLLMMMDRDRRRAMDEFLRDSRPVADWMNQFRPISVRWKQPLHPEQKALELFFTVLTSDQGQQVRLCRGCEKPFLPERSNKKSCSLRCHRKFHRSTPKGKRLRAEAKRRSRKAKREMRLAKQQAKAKRKEELIARSAQLKRKRRN